MYLILVKQHYEENTYTSVFTESLPDVARALESKKTVKIYNLDSLTEIKEVELTEITGKLT